ncbi:hypothetical protein ACFFGT_09830 [Mucilaginibacter angelicae]|uniref:Uncharacterized protein n=1 Tax=Mucilaginibacter angelicae TaxID=869718 RepID=A0ABV6L4Y7_9SPHI
MLNLMSWLAFAGLLLSLILMYYLVVLGLYFLPKWWRRYCSGSAPSVSLAPETLIPAITVDGNERVVDYGVPDLENLISGIYRATTALPDEHAAFYWLVGPVDAGGLYYLLLGRCGF